jgi:hypothetical protein
MTTSTQRQLTPEQQQRLLKLIEEQMKNQMVMGSVIIDGR